MCSYSKDSTSKSILKNDPDSATLSRRDFVRKATLATGAGYAAVVAGFSQAQEIRGRQDTGPRQSSLIDDDRARQVLQTRIDAAQQQQLREAPNWHTNDDEASLDGFIGNFSKTLPHNE